MTVLAVGSSREVPHDSLWRRRRRNPVRSPQRQYMLPLVCRALWLNAAIVGMWGSYVTGAAQGQAVEGMLWMNGD